MKEWPAVGERVYTTWSAAHTNLPALVQSWQPKIGNLAQAALGVVASIGGELLLFLASFIIAGIVMAYGESGADATRAIFARIAGEQRGETLTDLSTATTRAVAQGVIGVAFIQAIIVGLALLVAGVPFAGIFAIVALLLGIAQVPALIVTLPAIAYIWASGEYSTGMATTHTIILVVAGMADNVLKPLLLGRGVDAPMPVILFGALGGMASAGILGMFVGATLLAMGYRIFMSLGRKQRRTRRGAGKAANEASESTRRARPCRARGKDTWQYSRLHLPAARSSQLANLSDPISNVLTPRGSTIGRMHRPRPPPQDCRNLSNRHRMTGGATSMTRSSIS